MESIWQKDTELPAFPKFQGSCGTDVLIIGGGMTGILTAYFLNNSGAECILLEKNRILSGTTSGTTAKITFQHGLIYNKLIRKKVSNLQGCIFRHINQRLKCLKISVKISTAILNTGTAIYILLMTGKSLNRKFPLVKR